MTPDAFHAERVRVDQQTGCWLWTGGTSSGGYGRVWYKGRLTQAHRAFYDQLVGPIPDGQVLHHTCETPACVNPAHLMPTTHQVNIQISRRAKLCRRDVRKIRALARQGVSYTEIGRRMGVTDRCASFVARGRMWRNVA